MSALPDGFSEERGAPGSYRDGEAGLVVSYRWRARTRLGAAWITLLGVGITGFGVALASAPLLGIPFRVPVPMALAAALAVVVAGTAVLYVAAASWVETTTVRLTRTALTRRSTPLPWPGDLTLRRGAGDRIETRRRGPGYRHTYVVVLVQDEIERDLFTGIAREEDADRVTQVLRDALHA